MLKYFKRQKSRLSSFKIDDNDHCKSNNSKVNDEVDCGVNDSETLPLASANAVKRHSLRSTSSFCDEVFFEELDNVSLMISTSNEGIEQDESSCVPVSLNAIGNGGSIRTGANSITASTSILEFNEDIFKCHSRLSMCITSIVNDPNCLSYFVQYLETRNALPLIKFYLDTANFKNAALAQRRREEKRKLIVQVQQIPKEAALESLQVISHVKSNNNTDDNILQNKQLQQTNNLNEIVEAEACAGAESAATDSSIVPELKTLCDLTMRKPLTDDEKSQFYAETTKQLTKSNDKSLPKVSSERSLCSLVSSFTETFECVPISNASIQDAFTVYQKYLSPCSPQHIEIPVDILSEISLVLCKKDQDEVNCAITSNCFEEAQQFILNKLEKEFLNDFLQCTYYAKYCVELIQSHNLNINDILHSEVTLFYLMEYLEQHKERDCLEFWSTAINYRKSYLSQEAYTRNEKGAQTDAMIIYEKFFSLQNEVKLWSSNKLRSHVESCICTDGLVFCCFDLPLKVAAKYLECKYLKLFLKSSLFANYLNELKTRIDEDFEHKEACSKISSFHKPLRHCTSDRTPNLYRKSSSDCAFEKKLPISQQNTLLASMDSNSSHLKQFQLNIDSSQLTNPDLLWQRSNSKNLKFGRVNSLGRYERDFMSPTDALHNISKKSPLNWSLGMSSNKIKNAMRKLVHLPDDNVQEEIAWQVAEMIVKDITSVTMRREEEKNYTKKNPKS